MDNVDLVAAREHGVAVCNLRDYCTPSVVQHVFAMILALTHRLREYDSAGAQWRLVSANQFSVFPYPIRELQGRVLGIVGYGALGRGVSKLGAALGMDVRIANRPGADRVEGRVDLAELLPQVDVLTLHCPLTPATRGMLDATQLAQMKADALLINTARGALVECQRPGACPAQGPTRRCRYRCAGAGTAGGRQCPARPSIPNLLLTPHVAWAARESRQRCLDELAGNVLAFINGERRNRVD